MDRWEINDALCTTLTVVTSDDDKTRVILEHRRLRHMSFDSTTKIFIREVKVEEE
jgi:hypothetical protein